MNLKKLEIEVNYCTNARSANIKCMLIVSRVHYSDPHFLRTEGS